MNRGHWKQYSSWEPEEKAKALRGGDDAQSPVEVHVKKGYTWSEQLGIAIACLVDNDKKDLVEWTKQVFGLVQVNLVKCSHTIADPITCYHTASENR